MLAAMGIGAGDRVAMVLENRIRWYEIYFAAGVPRLAQSSRKADRMLEMLRRQERITEAKPNEDGSYTIHFGGDPESTNYLPISEGWNYAIRMYQPRKEILDGAWTFPNIEAVK